jgi:hypothetical protein
MLQSYFMKHRILELSLYSCKCTRSVSTGVNDSEEDNWKEILNKDICPISPDLAVKLLMTSTTLYATRVYERHILID